MKMVSYHRKESIVIYRTRSERVLTHEELIFECADKILTHSASSIDSSHSIDVVNEEELINQ